MAPHVECKGRDGTSGRDALNRRHFAPWDLPPQCTTGCGLLCMLYHHDVSRAAESWDRGRNRNWIVLCRMKNTVTIAIHVPTKRRHLIDVVRWTGKSKILLEQQTIVQGHRARRVLWVRGWGNQPSVFPFLLPSLILTFCTPIMRGWWGLSFPPPAPHRLLLLALPFVLLFLLTHMEGRLGPRTLLGVACDGLHHHLHILQMELDQKSKQPLDLPQATQRCSC